MQVSAWSATDTAANLQSHQPALAQTAKQALGQGVQTCPAADKRMPFFSFFYSSTQTVFHSFGLQVEPSRLKTGRLIRGEVSNK